MRKVPVTERALVQRINRKLAKQNQALRKARGDRAAMDLGEYYILDNAKNAVLFLDVDLEKEGRELGVLAPHENLAD